MLARRRFRQKELGEVLGVTQGQVSGRLTGEVQWRIAELWTVSDWLGIPLTELIAPAEVRSKALA